MYYYNTSVKLAGVYVSYLLFSSDEFTLLDLIAELLALGRI